MESKNPIYDRVMAEFESLDFARDRKGRFTDYKPNPTEGWYQNSAGELFHYDGVVWDQVPEETLNNLEFLGE